MKQTKNQIIDRLKQEGAITTEEALILYSNKTSNFKVIDEGRIVELPNPTDSEWWFWS